MRFMMMVRHKDMQGPPPKALMDAIYKLADDAVKSKAMIANGGLAPLAASTRVRCSHGKVTALDGPFAEAKEVVGGFAIFELKSKQEAIDSAVEFMELHRKHWPEWEGETEVRQIFDPGEFAAQTK
jgi:hypothetical protein